MPPTAPMYVAVASKKPSLGGTAALVTVSAGELAPGRKLGAVRVSALVMRGSTCLLVVSVLKYAPSSKPASLSVGSTQVAWLPLSKKIEFFTNSVAGVCATVDAPSTSIGKSANDVMIVL